MRVKEMRARGNWPPMNADKRRWKNKCVIGVHRRSSAANSVFSGLLVILTSTHLENPAHLGESSEGCIVLSALTGYRDQMPIEQLRAAGEDQLTVTA
jgi:hypothetical protein